MNETLAAVTVQKDNLIFQPSPTPALITSTGEVRWWKKSDPTRSFLRLETYLQIKRVLDVLIIIFLLPVLLPVIIICAILIRWLSPGGSVLFKQERTGKGGKRYTMFKFRTMVPNAEKMKAELASLNEFTWPDFKVTDDPRITKIGKYLRKTSLDELPQILNVLKGDIESGRSTTDVLFLPNLPALADGTVRCTSWHHRSVADHRQRIVGI